MGHSSSIVTCLLCESQSRREEKFYDVPLHFTEEEARRKCGTAGGGSGVELTDMLERFLQAEVMSGDNQFHCENCSKSMSI